MQNTLEQILTQREVQAERAVAYLRAALMSVASLLDCLAFAGLIPPYSIGPPTTGTLLFDCLFLGVACVFAGLAARGVYRSYFKFFSITLDYVLLIVIFAFDPSVSAASIENLWLAVIGPVFLFYLNLIRFSRAAAFYAAALSVPACAVMASTVLGSFETQEIVRLQFGLVMLIAIGLSISSAGRTMMEQANTKQMLERYLPPQLVEELQRSKATLQPGGRRQVVTMLFADIRGFSRISESLSPEHVVELLNDYLSTMTDVIFRHEGTIDKFIGDAVMTTFGAPIERADDVVRAYLAAREMISALDDFNLRHPELETPLEIGIGLHTGEVIAGNIGSAKRLDYTVIGDNVNLTSRIEGLTKHYGCRILATAAVIEGLRSCGLEPAAREIDTVIVRGKTRAVVIYELLAEAQARGSYQHAEHREVVGG